MTTISPDTTLVDALAYQKRVFHWAREAGLTTVRLGIYQPKVNGASEWTCSMDDLAVFALELHAKAAAVRDADEDHATMPFEKWWPVYLNLEPNDVDCAFCRAMPVCPSTQAKLQRDAGVDFSAVSEDQPPAVPTEALDINRAMNCVPLMEAWLKAVRAEAERQSLAGVELADWGLELGRQGNREFVDPEAAEELMRKTFRLRLEDVYSFKLKSPTQIEKLTKAEKLADGTVAAPTLGTRQWAKLEKLVTRADPKPSMRPRKSIKVPYKVAPLTTEGFGAVVEDGAEDFT